MSYPPGQPQRYPQQPQQQFPQPAGDPYGIWMQTEPSREAPPRRRRRVFPWVFLAIQALFVIWVIAGVAGGGSIDSGAAAYCHAHPSQFLPFSQCVSDYGGGEKVGAAIGLGLVVALWALVDIILGISYAVWRLARR